MPVPALLLIYSGLEADVPMPPPVVVKLIVPALIVALLLASVILPAMLKEKVLELPAEEALLMLTGLVLAVPPLTAAVAL